MHTLISVTMDTTVMLLFFSESGRIKLVANYVLVSF